MFGLSLPDILKTTQDRGENSNLKVVHWYYLSLVKLFTGANRLKKNLVDKDKIKIDGQCSTNKFANKKAFVISFWMCILSSK